MTNQKSSSGIQTSNVFYTFGFLLLYIHFCLNIWSLFLTKKFFDSQMSYTIKIFGNDRLSLKMGIEEILLVGGFILFTIIGIILERTRMIFLSKRAEEGWRYRNRLKNFYALIAIILVVWITVHGRVVQKSFDWVWISAGIVILIYSLFLISYPKLRKAKS